MVKTVRVPPGVRWSLRRVFFVSFFLLVVFHVVECR